MMQTPFNPTAEPFNRSRIRVNEKGRWSGPCALCGSHISWITEVQAVGAVCKACENPQIVPGGHFNSQLAAAEIQYNGSRWGEGEW